MFELITLSVVENAHNLGVMARAIVAERVGKAKGYALIDQAFDLGVMYIIETSEHERTARSRFRAEMVKC